MQLRNASPVQMVQLPELPQLVEIVEPTTVLECSSKTV